ncbi:MAG: TSUP family transporter [Betaproteobacteria bacterium]|nr:TSUP family transporter [Betaproteobacteria bacterium]
MSSTLVFACIAVAVLITSFISGILGMAGGMILMGVLLALLPLPAAMMLHGITQMASNGWRAWLWRANVDWRIFRGYAYGAFLALGAFTAVQLVVSKPVAYILLGLTPFVSYMLPQRLTLNVDTRGHPLACGVICTSLQLVAGVSGPLLDVFFVRSKMDRKGVVATKAMSQTLGHLIKIGYFGAIALYFSAGALDSIAGALSIPLALTCVLLAFTGTSLSKRVLEKMSDANFRQWTQRTVLTMGVFYLANGGWLMFRGG